MKKTLLFACALATVLAACGGKDDEKKTETTVAESGATECVVSGDVVYVNVDYILSGSELYAKEGAELQKKVQLAQEKIQKAQEGWANTEKGLQAEYTKLQNEAAKLQEDYGKGLITTLNAQQKQEELQKKGDAIQQRINNYQQRVQKEDADLQAEARNLDEENAVLMNRFQDLMQRAVKEINADKRYKMILSAVVVVDAEPTLNISDLVLAKVNELYAADNK